MNYHLPLAAATFLATAGCTLGPDFHHPGVTGGSRWKEGSVSSSARLPDEWWKLFGDGELNRLVNRALAANNDISSARARMDTARALVGVDRARMFPQLNLTGGATGYRSSAAVTPSTGGVKPNLQGQNYQAAFNLSYEPDLWGRNRRQLEASNADANASQGDLDALRLGVAAETARQFFLIRALDRQHAIVVETLRTRGETLDLQQSKATAGLADGLTTSSARTQLELARNDLASVERQRGAAEHALAVLCGARPSDFTMPAVTSMPRLPSIRPGLPANVLRRRPDVRAAEERLHAANARVGVAETAFYPNFTLVGAGGFQALDAAQFLNWENRALSIGLNLASPIIDAGANRSRKSAAVAQYQAALASYRQVILVALREVEDSLTDLKTLDRSRGALTAALASAQETNRLTRDRQNKGLSSYLEVVDADRTVLQIRLSLAEIEGQQRVSFANLAKALGGGWK
jgi:multidrug efflux system outer membrane protein